MGDEDAALGVLVIEEGVEHSTGVSLLGVGNSVVVTAVVLLGCNLLGRSGVLVSPLVWFWFRFLRCLVGGGFFVSPSPAWGLLLCAFEDCGGLGCTTWLI